jgi:SAM-dependent methyltransferase
MHYSSLENMQLCINSYIHEGYRKGAKQLTVVDVGSMDVNGSYRMLFKPGSVKYTGVDLVEGKGVDVVVDDPYHLPFASDSVDLVICGQMMEHCEYFWLAFQEMIRILSPRGYLFLIAPSSGPIHRYPVDCYRFNPDAYHALAKLAGSYLIESWHDERGPWKDVVGVFSKDSGALRRPSAPKKFEVYNEVPNDDLDPEGTERGVESYLNVLSRIHRLTNPQSYLEIGVRSGRSFRLASCSRIGVDPAVAPDADLGGGEYKLFEISSDEFFRQKLQELDSPDFVFIDGMHRFENVLRDFMNVEKISKSHTIVCIDDIFPNTQAQGLRERRSRVWAGDVWKIRECLQKYRPDLVLIALDTEPTGMLLIVGLDSCNRILWDSYNTIMREYVLDHTHEVSPAALQRIGAIDPREPDFEGFLQTIDSLKRQLGQSARIPSAAYECLRNVALRSIS